MAGKTPGSYWTNWEHQKHKEALVTPHNQQLGGKPVEQLSCHFHFPTIFFYTDVILLIWFTQFGFYLGCCHAEDDALSTALYCLQKDTQDIKPCSYFCEVLAPWKPRNLIREVWLRFVSQKISQVRLYPHSTTLKANILGRYLKIRRYVDEDDRHRGINYKAKQFLRPRKISLALYTDTNSACNKRTKRQTKPYNTNPIFF